VSAKQELLDESARQYTALHESMQGLDEAQMTEVWLGTWCVRDIVAHISGWHRELGPALERLSRGEHPNPEGKNYEAEVDAWNEKFVAPKRDTPVADVLVELDESHKYFMHVAAQVPDDKFAEGKIASKIVTAIAPAHYRVHGEQIRVWRAARGKTG
jgi:hypothetical protein